METSVGLEGVWSALANKAESFTSTINGVLERGYDLARFKQVRGALDSLFTRPPVSLTPGIDPSILKWFQQVDYLSVSPVTVFVPRGLCVPYATYVERLSELVKLASELPRGLLNPVNAMLGTAINNPSFLRSASKLPLNAMLLDKSPEKAVSALSECFDKGVSDQMPFGKAYRSLADYQAIKTSAGEIQALAASPSMKEIEKAAMLIVDHVETLTRNMNEDETFPSISNVVKKQLVETVNHCAKWVELYAVLQYQVMVLNAALTDTDKKMKSVAKR